MSNLLFGLFFLIKIPKLNILININYIIESNIQNGKKKEIIKLVIKYINIVEKKSKKKNKDRLGGTDSQ